MIATKEQERKALEEVKSIVEGLGEQSYLSIAFAGCFEIAERNIDFDFADSMAEMLEITENELKSEHRQLKAANDMIQQLSSKVKELEKQIDELADWEIDPNVGTKLPQSDYSMLEEQSDTRKLTDEEAKSLIEKEFGFKAECVEIIHDVQTYKKSRPLNKTKIEGEFHREPLYNASDWNYIRFNCAGLQYEMINGELEQYCD